MKNQTRKVLNNEKQQAMCMDFLKKEQELNCERMSALFFSFKLLSF